MVFPPLETRRLWKVTFTFDNIGELEGFLRFSYEARSEMIENSSIIKKIVSSLPIVTEGVVLRDREILIKLPPRFRQKIFRRDHIIKPGQIVYRPHIPAISIIVYPTKLYEPTEIIGEIKRESRKIPKDSPPEKLVQLLDHLSRVGSVLVRINLASHREKSGEIEE